MNIVTSTMAIVACVFLAACTQSNSQVPTPHIEPTPIVDMKLTKYNLETDTSKISIPLEEILSGGPGKDGIPALFEPTFTTAAAVDFLQPESRGLLLTIGNTTKFYPYDILYWHEIVNDTVEGTPVAVTFCPLCGSAITFDRRVHNTELTFGVSGLLWQSNLLMYDKQTESLWSQIEGTAKVGTYNGTTLTVLQSDVITFKQVQQHHPDALVQELPTQYNRDYGRNPYGTYEEEARTIFPVNTTDSRFFAKDIFAITTVGGTSVGFKRLALIEATTATIEVNNTTITATYDEAGSITITDETGTKYPLYHAMWFSWSNHNTNLVAWPVSN